MASRVGAKRVFGRSLSDFGTLWPAEDALLECSRIGAPTVISETRPEAETKTNRVRAAFVRFLALGGDEQAPVHENGVELQGAWRSEEHTSELQSLMRISYAVFCLKK